MPQRETPEAMLPGTYVLRDSDIERIVRAVRGETPSHDEFEDMAEKAASRAVRTFLLEVGIDPNDLPGLRKDFAEMRSFREMKASIKDNGLRALVTMLVTGLGVWFWAKVKGSP